LAVHPGWPAALLGLGLCARQRRDLPAAVEHLAAAVAAAPNDRAARHEYATTLRELGRLGEAEAAYQQTLAADPGWFPAFMGLGLCARQRRDLPAAAEHLAAAVAAAPNDRGARHEYATTLRELGRLEEAEAAYRQLLAAHPDWSPALLGQGLCARQRGDRAEAMARFQAAAAAMPDNSAAWLEVLTEHTDAGRLDEARAIAARMLERDRACPQGWLGLGRIERQAGNRAAALEAFEQGHARCPGQQNFLIEMGIETQALGRFAEAETWLQQAASIERLAPLALTLLGEQARMAQRFEDAVTLFRRSVERRDAPVSSHTALAQTLADLGRPEEALATLDAAERHFGARPELAMRRASLLRRTGLRDEALALVRSANAAAPSHFPLWYERFENERFATVPEGDTPIDLDALLQAAPAASVRERALVHHARGLLAEQCWQLEAAADEHRQAIALDGAHGGMHEALARVSLLLCDTETARQQLLATMRLATPMRQLQGLSLHLAHTHLGQILDEYLMDPAALAALADAQAQPPAERIAALLTLARDRPDSTPAAIALLIALRQAGWLAGPPADAPSGRVPPAIAQYWNEQAPPDDVSRLMQTWPEQNPGHRYVRFDAAAAQAFLAQHCMPDVLLAYRRSREPAKQADLFRLAWLFCEGGVYADADDRCLRPLEAWLPAGADLVLYQEEYGTLGNNFIAATPFHPVLGLALRMAVTAINRGDDDLLWLSTGPGLISRALVQTLATSCLTPPAWLRRMAILQRHELAQGVAAHCMAGYQNTKQYWQRAAFRGPKGRQPAPQ
jgi:tetratricopeptide (TPR) repeat protein